MQKIRKAVIPAAGFGTRFLPATKAMPKEMLPIVDKPAIQYIVEEILASGIREILIISGHAKRAIEDHFDSSPELEQHLLESGKMKELEEIQKISSIKVHYVRQSYMRGLGDAILCAREFVDKVSSYGMIRGEKTENPDLLKVVDMIEKPSIKEAPSRFASLGRYVITPEVFDILEQTKPGKGGEIQLTDAHRVMARCGNVYAYNFTGKRYDTGNKLGYLKAVVEFALRREDLGEGFREYLKSLPL